MGLMVGGVGLMHVAEAVSVSVKVPQPPEQVVAQGSTTVEVGVSGQRGLCAGTVVVSRRTQKGRMQVVVMKGQSDCSASKVVVAVKQGQLWRLAWERLELVSVVATEGQIPKNVVDMTNVESVVGRSFS
jgi:hypothetical protein